VVGTARLAAVRRTIEIRSSLHFTQAVLALPN
jgi:hypothetical protein